MIGVLVVVEDLLDVDAALATGRERVREPLRCELAIDPDRADRVVARGPREEPGERVDEGPSGRTDLYDLPPRIRNHFPNLHNRPSACSWRIKIGRASCRERV